MKFPEKIFCELFCYKNYPFYSLSHENVLQGMPFLMDFDIHFVIAVSDVL